MIEALIHAAIGLFVSFMGSIPFGSVNLSVMQMSISRGLRAAIEFIIGAVMAEMVYAYIAIKLAHMLVNNISINLTIEIVAISILTVLGVYNLLKKVHEHHAAKRDKLKPFLKGVVVGFINPMAIPFWITYTTYFELNHFIHLDAINTLFYIVGIAIGSFCLLALFAKGAKRLDEKIDIGERLINRIIGVALLLMACYQLWHALFVTLKK